MSVAAARDLFGWRMDPNELRKIRKSPARFTYPFGLLSLAGASVQNPTSLLDGRFHTETAGPGFDDDPDVLVGLAALRPFHVYISHKDQLIYLTAADAR
jgi:hypothetical protein